jgi:putative two-component system response regulator
VEKIMAEVHSFISKATILVIDNDADNLTIISDLLKVHCKAVIAARDGEEALKMVQTDSPCSLILLSINLPKLHGYDLCRLIKADPGRCDISIILLTEQNDVVDDYGLEIGAVDYITKPINPALVLARVKTHLEMKGMKDALQVQSTFLERQTHKRTAELMATQNAAIHIMAYMAETRDNVSGNHIYRIENYIKLLAQKLRFHPRFADLLNTDNNIELLSKTATLHDIGSIGVPERIILKPGRLTAEEFEIMKTHTSRGLNFILQAKGELGIELPFLKFAKEIVYSHHERWDGSGYPEGLAGDAIPISARLMAIADVYDALISRRVYKPPMTHDQAVKTIIEGKGKQFDPYMADAFNEIHSEIQRISWDFADNDKDFKKRIDYLEQAIAVAP